MRKVTLGLLQHACTGDPKANLKKTLALAEKAAKKGAKIICTQELFRSQYFCQSEDHDNFLLAESIPGPSTQAFQKIAKKHGVEDQATKLVSRFMSKDKPQLDLASASGWYPANLIAAQKINIGGGRIRAIGGAAGGWVGAGVALVAIFVASFLLIIGVLPYWSELVKRPSVRAAVMAANAAVVGVLAAAFYHPVFTSAIIQPRDLALAIVTYVALTAWKIPSWVLVLLSGGFGGWLLG